MSFTFWLTVSVTQPFVLQCQFHEALEDDEDVHIVMELCTGGQLAHSLAKRHYSERTVRRTVSPSGRNSSPSMLRMQPLPASSLTVHHACRWPATCVQS